MKKERKSKGWKERRTERERPLEFTWSDLKAGIILFSPSSSILLANHYISSVACLPRFFYNVDHPPYSPSFSPPRHVKRKESIFYHVFPRNHVSAEGNERKSEKKRERDSFFFFLFLIADRFVSAFVIIRDSIDFTSSDIYLFQLIYTWLEQSV